MYMSVIILVLLVIGVIILIHDTYVIMRSSKCPNRKTRTESKSNAPYNVGANYLIRTVTHTYTGKLVWVGDKELVIEDTAWIADSGRWMQAVRDGVLDEVEPMTDRTIIGRGAIIDASEITWSLPKDQK